MIEGEGRNRFSAVQSMEGENRIFAVSTGAVWHKLEDCAAGDLAGLIAALRSRSVKISERVSDQSTEGYRPIMRAGECIESSLGPRASCTRRKSVHRAAAEATYTAVHASPGGGAKEISGSVHEKGPVRIPSVDATGETIQDRFRPSA